MLWLLLLLGLLCHANTQGGTDLDDLIMETMNANKKGTTPLSPPANPAKTDDLEDLIDEIFHDKKKKQAVDDSSRAKPPTGDETCRCIPYYLCNRHEFNYENLTALIDTRLGEGEEKSCSNQFEICCKPHEKLDSDDITRERVDDILDAYVNARMPASRRIYLVQLIQTIHKVQEKSNEFVSNTGSCHCVPRDICHDKNRYLKNSGPCLAAEACCNLPDTLVCKIRKIFKLSGKYSSIQAQQAQTSNKQPPNRQKLSNKFPCPKDQIIDTQKNDDKGTGSSSNSKGPTGPSSSESEDLDALVSKYVTTKNKGQETSSVLNKIIKHLENYNRNASGSPFASCHCVPYYFCFENNSATAVGNFCPGLDVCCYLPDNIIVKLKPVLNLLNSSGSDMKSTTEGSLDDLISSMLQNNKQSTTESNKNEGDDNLDDLISDVFGNGPGDKDPTKPSETTTTSSQVNRNCKCVPHYLCTEDTQDTLNFYQCADYMMVCCPEKFISKDNSSLSTRPTQRPPLTDLEQTTSSNAACECVAPNLCKESTVEITVLEGQALDHFLSTGQVGSGSGLCRNSEDVCCKREHVILHPSSTAPSTPQGSDCRCVPFDTCSRERVVNMRCRSKNEVCCSVIDGSNQQCGRRNVPQRPVPGMDVSPIGEFPWTVAIMREEYFLLYGTRNKKIIYQCDGALIHPRIVLTPAHCVQPKTTLRVRANEPNSYRDHNVNSAIIHPSYVAAELINDIAILVLDSPVKLTKNVNVICLPPQDYTFNVINKKCYASGGRSTDDFVGYNHKEHIPVITKQFCERALHMTHFAESFRLHQSFLCAGEYGKNLCNGYIGSTLACPVSGSEETYQLAGLYIKSFGCGKYTAPDMFTNVAKFRNWIDAQIKNLDTSNYYTG